MTAFRRKLRRTHLRSELWLASLIPTRTNEALRCSTARIIYVQRDHFPRRDPYLNHGRRTSLAPSHHFSKRAVGRVQPEEG